MAANRISFSGSRWWRSARRTLGALGSLYALAFAVGVARGATEPGTTRDGAPTDGATVTAVVPGGRVGEYRHGTYPSLGDRTHVGVDIVAPCGTPIQALEQGRIVDRIRSRADADFSSLGYMVIVEHPAQITGRVFYSLYLHLQAPPEPDEQVARGEQIGRVGATGRATGCHLHLEVRYFRDRVSRRWNHIYGRGDQRDSHHFRESWEDPVAFIARLLGDRRRAAAMPRPGPDAHQPSGLR